MIAFPLRYRDTPWNIADVCYFAGTMMMRRKAWNAHCYDCCGGDNSGGGGCWASTWMGAAMMMRKRIMRRMIVVLVVVDVLECRRHVTLSLVPLLVSRAVVRQFDILRVGAKPRTEYANGKCDACLLAWFQCIERVVRSGTTEISSVFWCVPTLGVVLSTIEKGATPVEIVCNKGRLYFVVWSKECVGLGFSLFVRIMEDNARG